MDMFHMISSDRPMLKTTNKKVPYSQPLLFIISFMLNGTLILLILALLVLRGGGGDKKVQIPIWFSLKIKYQN